MVQEIVNPLEDPTRQRLLEAAEEVFSEVGFEAATVREICQRASVKNIGAVNYYFQGKERLYSAAVMRAFETCAAGAPMPAWGPTVSAADRLRDFISIMMMRMLEIPRLSAIRLMMREMTEPSSNCGHAVEQHIKPMANVLHGIFAELLPELPLDRRWLIGFSVMGQCLFYRQNRAVISALIGAEQAAKVTDARLLADHIIQFTFAAMGIASPIAGSPGRGS